MRRMVRRSKRSRSLRKIFYVTPSKKTKKRYERRKSKITRCAICKTKIQGISTSRKLSKTKKKPKRKFSGELCHKCVQEVMKLSTRVKDKEIDIFDVGIRYKKYVEQIL